MIKGFVKFQGASAVGSPTTYWCECLVKKRSKKEKNAWTFSNSPSAHYQGQMAEVDEKECQICGFCRVKLVRCFTSRIS